MTPGAAVLRQSARARQSRRLSCSSPSCSESPVLACHVYVSEGSQGQDSAMMEGLRRAASTATSAALLANVFVDAPYNRSNFTLLGSSPSGLAAAATALARAALSAVDLRLHDAAHPRVGAVDHISCHPLAPSTAAGMAMAVQAARRIGEQLGSGPLAVPVFLYGHAHPQQLALDEVRRQLGYFARAKSGRWHGPPQASGWHDPPPSYGPAIARPESGVCCIGAVPWLVNFNILLDTVDMAAARQVGRAVSQRSGGLHSVQAMALRHGEGVEVACNLLDPEAVQPAAVEAAVRLAAAAAGIAVVRAYRIGKTQEELTALALERFAPERRN